MGDRRMPYNLFPPTLEDTGLCTPRLECPRCGDYGGLHHYDVRVHERVASDGEDGDGMETRIRGTSVRSRKIIDERMIGRRNSILIGFWCEHCDTFSGPHPSGRAPLVLVISQHKGSTFVGWLSITIPDTEERDDDPDGLNAEFREVTRG